MMKSTTVFVFYYCFYDTKGAIELYLMSRFPKQDANERMVTTHYPTRLIQFNTSSLREHISWFLPIVSVRHLRRVLVLVLCNVNIILQNYTVKLHVVNKGFVIATVKSP